MKLPLLILSGLIFSGLSYQGNTSTPARVSTVMAAGEELVYEVRWSMIKLGVIRVKTLPARNPGTVFSAVAYSDSYDIPFVNFHAFSTSEMDSTLYSTGASLYETKDGQWLRQVYYFNPARRTYVTEHAVVKSLDSPPVKAPTFDTLNLSYNRFQDGTSILYFARAHAHDVKPISVPTLVRGKAGTAHFYFPGERTTETIDAVSNPVKVIQIEGKADFEGIFGLTGDFVGWFSDDAAAVPIKATMKVILGSITLELKEWKRPGWSPPEA